MKPSIITPMIELIPVSLQDTLEMKELMLEYERLAQDQADATYLVITNATVKHCDEDALLLHELTYRIQFDPTESIEFRRQRLLTRMAVVPPYSLHYFKTLLDTYLGEGTYSIEWASDFEIKVTLEGTNPSIEKEILDSILLNILPANIKVGIESNVPIEYVEISENAFLIKMEYFKLGTSKIGMKLGQEVGREELDTNA